MTNKPRKTEYDVVITALKNASREFDSDAPQLNYFEYTVNAVSEDNARDQAKEIHYRLHPQGAGVYESYIN